MSNTVLHEAYCHTLRSSLRFGSLTWSKMCGEGGGRLGSFTFCSKQLCQLLEKYFWQKRYAYCHIANGQSGSTEKLILNTSAQNSPGDSIVVGPPKAAGLFNRPAASGVDPRFF